MNIKLFFLRSAFAFIVLLMPVIALAPPGDSVYEVTDFFGYYTQALLLAEKPRQDVYDPQKLVVRAREMYPPLNSHGPYYVAEPPFSLTFLFPISLLPAEHALIIFKVFLILITAFSMTLLAITFEQSERQFLYTTVAVAISGPFWEATRVTKPGLIVLLGLSLSLWYLKKQKLMPGALFLLPWTIRPQTFLFLFAEFTGARQWRLVIYIAAVTLVLFLLSLPLFGLENYQSWQKYMQYMSYHHEITAPFLHPTIRGQLMRIAAVPANTVNVVYIGIFAIALVAAILFGHRFKKTARWLQLCTVCMPLGVVAGPYCHNYDLVLLIPSVIAFFKLPALASLTKPWRIACWTVVGLCLLCFEMPAYGIIHYSFLQRNIWIISPLFVSLLIMSLIFVYMAWRDSGQTQELPGKR